MKLVRLGEVTTIDRKSIDPSAIESGTYYVGLEHLNSDGTMVRVNYVEPGDLASNKFRFTSDHVLFGKLRPYLRKIALPDSPGICSTDILPILPGPEIDRGYLFHFLRLDKTVALASSLSSGANLPRLSPSALQAIEVPLPPLTEQRRIATILDQADALRAKRRAAIAKLDALPGAIFFEMFGDIEVNPRGYERQSVGAACLRVTDGTHQPPKWESAGIPFLFVSNIRNGSISFDTQKFISADTYHALTRRCPIEEFDVLYTTVGSYGHAALVTTNTQFAFQRHIAHLKPRLTRYDPHFFAAMLGSPGFRKQADALARGVAQKTLNLVDLKAMKVLCPPISEQRRFSESVKVIEGLRAKAMAALLNTSALIDLIQHRAFEGVL